MGAQGDIYKLVQRFVLGGVEALVRWYYEQMTVSGNAVDLVAAWYDDVTSDIMACTSSDCSMVGTEAINLNDSSDFDYEAYSPIPGSRGGVLAGTFDAWGFVKHSSDRKIRSGGMRVPGVYVADVSDGVPVSGELTLLNALAASLTANIADTGGVGTYAPRLYTEGNTKTGGDPFWCPITLTAFTRYTTQNTRKPWRP